MEEVPGIPGSLPPLALYPTREIQSNLPPEEWQACLDTWIFCLEFRLRLSHEHFSFFKLSQDACGLPFLLTYLQNLDRKTDKQQNHHKENERGVRVQHLCLLLLRRLLLGTRTPWNYPSAELFELLSNTSLVYSKSLVWRGTLKESWKRNPSEIKEAIETCKTSLTRQLSTSSPFDLKYAIAITKDLPECGLIFMTGSDFLEALTNGYSELQTLATEHAYLCLRSLMSKESPTQSLLLDHLYTMKSNADTSLAINPNTPTLLSNLVVSTPFLRHLDLHISGLQARRGQQLVEALRKYREQTLHLHSPPPIFQRKDGKGKGKARTSNNEMHMHQAAQVSQIHELFPDLSDHYILQLMDYFADDVEAVTAALLEPESLPSNLQVQTVATSNILPPRANLPTINPLSTQLPRRKNVFDGDDFDNLRISSDNIHIGRKNKLNDAAVTLDEHARSKAAILSALAAFDADDDERDDSYDVADVGGNVDDTVDTDSRSSNEELLYRGWRDLPDVFTRDSKTRLSQPRQKLKQDTGMTDEQIEGWAIMLSRDENMQNRLKQRYAASGTFSGDQKTVISTKWRAGSDSDDSGGGSGGGGGGGGRTTRGGHRGGRGRGNTAGPASSAAVQAARKRKEQGQGRGGAAHNRREGRAKKIGRGMMGPI